ncbi:hypothetical protein C1645_815299 [Glomus cerebriforme]|uniref:Uncharacterized protein n=1 Tax=Glomus cerebriforme TaxID=658196 RepID=A0A397TNI3_9GLOM|nr:hypothetical protein C1645_815299 [Glomus cerebriforme]
MISTPLESSYRDESNDGITPGWLDFWNTGNGCGFLDTELGIARSNNADFGPLDTGLWKLKYNGNANFSSLNTGLWKLRYNGQGEDFDLLDTGLWKLRDADLII